MCDVMHTALYLYYCMQSAYIDSVLQWQMSPYVDAILQCICDDEDPDKHYRLCEPMRLITYDLSQRSLWSVMSWMDLGFTSAASTTIMIYRR